MAMGVGAACDASLTATGATPAPWHVPQLVVAAGSGAVEVGAGATQAGDEGRPRARLARAFTAASTD